MNLTELRQQFPNLIQESAVEYKNAALWIQREGEKKILALLAQPGDSTLSAFEGEERLYPDGRVLKRCLLSHANAMAMRKTLTRLSPTLLGLQTSIGFGDRLGIATPGHVRALKALNANNIAPIFAQQSIREMLRTDRSPENVLDDATFGAFEAGWHWPVGADADHLKTTADIDACVAAGFTFFTIDPGEFVDSSVDDQEGSALRRKVDALPWDKLDSNPGNFDANYVGSIVKLETRDIELTKANLTKAAAKYGRAIAHVSMMYRHLVQKKVPFELEVSVDETETPTTHVEHIYIASELKRLGVEWISLAPRYVGQFEKGVDYIGDIEDFEKNFALHAEIARTYGPYKLSLHSGSDKFSVYAAAMRQTRGLVHLKTAGTSYLEALRTIAALDPKLFREIYAFTRERYETDRATYHVSAQLARAPEAKDLGDDALASLLDQFDARQILHVTFGSVLNARDNKQELRFYHNIMTLLRTHPDEYASNLEKHFIRHVGPFVD